MSFTPTAADINVIIIVPSDDKTSTSSRPLVQAERRISPSWTISQLKTKLEPVTGIPTSAQILRTKTFPDGKLVTLSDDDNTYVGDPAYGLHRGSEIEVIDTRPAAARQNFTDVSAVEKYEMPADQYEKLDDSVLAWKRRQKLGRFDPNAKSDAEMAEERRSTDTHAVQKKQIETGKRCRVGADDTRRGTVRFVGELKGLGGEREAGCIWVGIELDEPLGRNNGSVKIEVDGGKSVVKQVFTCKDKFGVFARPEKVEIGDFKPLDDFDEDMEEI